jgi:DUF1680 family protein
MRSPDGGLVCAVYAPCELSTVVDRRKVSISVQTDYPFKQDVRIVVTPETTMRFPIRVRIPSWAHGFTLRVNGQQISHDANVGTFVIVDRSWAPADVIELTLPMLPTVSRWYNNSVALMRGPLVFSHDPGQSWVKLRDRGPTADWQVYPTSFWNYALVANELTAKQIEVTEENVGSTPFCSTSAPVKLHVRARRLDEWRSEDGVAAPISKEVPATTNPEEILALVPYGCAKLRISAFPSLENNIVGEG